MPRKRGPRGGAFLAVKGEFFAEENLLSDHRLKTNVMILKAALLKLSVKP